MTFNSSIDHRDFDGADQQDHDLPERRHATSVAVVSASEISLRQHAPGHLDWLPFVTVNTGYHISATDIHHEFRNCRHD
jgi:hypothetical protein